MYLNIQDTYKNQQREKEIFYEKFGIWNDEIAGNFRTYGF